MAWISVHENVNGPKRRKLEKLTDCNGLEATGALVQLWLWGINNADCDGFLLDADKEDIVECIRHAGKIPREKAAKIVEGFIESGWLDFEDGSYSIHDWNVWQKQWYTALERRQKNTEYQRESRARRRQKAKEAGQLEMELPEKKEGQTAPEQSKPDATEAGVSGDTVEAEKPAPKKKPYPKPFQELWKIYPRKDEKASAYKAYHARLNDGYSPESLMTATRNYVQSIRRKHTDPNYIKLGKTFFGPNEPFVDYLPKEKDVFAEAAHAGTENPFADALEEGDDL